MKLSRGRQEAIETFRRAGGMLRTSQALKAGVHRRHLYALRDAGVLETVSRGVYRLAGLPPLTEPDLVTVASRVPKAVVCLISALHFHGLTTEIPHAVSIALPRGASRPKLDWPPVLVYRFSSPMFEQGIETHTRDGVKLRVYRPAKAVADCFKFRNQLGIEVPLEALRTGLRDGSFKPAEVMRFAKVCRVDEVLRPFLEALL